MPILELQRRMRQLGEIRIGRVVDTGRISQRTQRPIMRPEKLDRFRVTSASKPLLEEVAALYGGTVQPWTPANGGPAEWEVYTDADRLPVLVPPRDPVTQWYELYKGSKCVRRCDGVTEQKSDKPCLCNPEQRDCQITTRLNVMLRDVPGLGVWLLTSHGYYAGTELPEVAEFLATTRGYVDAWLAMEEKQVVRDNGDVARFMVPKLDVAVTPAQLLAGQGAVSPAAVEATAARAAITGNGPAAIEAPKAAPPAAAQPTAETFIAAAVDSKTLNDLSTNLKAAQHAGFARNLGDASDLVAVAFMKRRAELSSPSTDQPAAQAPPAGDPDLIWQQIVAASPWPMSELRERFITASGGVAPEDAGVQDLTDFLNGMKAGV
ncbi:hypothetical protein ABZ912_19780 [Nonomuraea angiospora]|uniref:recombination directionality factor n=1 Tax=Nonomuraea angiospora TaxID=46172 RepID=UPI0033E9A3B8